MIPFFKKKIIDESPEEQREEFITQLSKSGLHISIQGDCDFLENSYGEFGCTHTNPIPVNGVLGELKYLHRLRCECKEQLYFHRIGNRAVDWITGGVDVYETVCYRGNHWDILYFHFYHPRRSKQIPKYYSFSNFHPDFSRIPIVIGTNRYVEGFPFNLGTSVKMFLGDSLKPFADKIIADYERNIQKDPSRFERPQKQIIKYQEAMVNIAARLY